MKNIISLIILSSILFFSCEEIMPPIADPEIPATERVVLLEELTGATCPNCPKGTAAVEAILNKFPGKVAAIGIHGEFLSSPVPNKSKYDFRNPKAAALENWFQPWLGKPAATVNRIDLDNPDQKYATVSTGQWQGNVEKELLKPHQLTLLLNVTYDSVTRIVEIDYTAIPLEDLAGSYNTTVFLTESKIIDAQTNVNVIIDDFEHNHVLRDIVTKFDGDAFGSDLIKGETYKRKYSYTLPVTEDGLWKAENMEVIVAIHHNSPSDRSVVQAAFKHIKE
jgi:hypothetical protein